MIISESRYTLRNLRKAPAFALTAILTLALGIGLSTAVFTVVDSVILKPLSYRDSGKLVVVWEKVKYLVSEASPYTGPNPRHATIWQERSRSFDSLCLLNVGTRGISLAGDHPRLIGSIRAQPNFLDVLDVKPRIGRGFEASDALKGRDQVAILTYALWQNLFHQDPNVLGKSVRLGGVPYQVVGVLPKDFQFPKGHILNSSPSKQAAAAAPPVEIVVPAAINPNDYGWNSDYGNWIALGRLKSNVSVLQAESDLNRVQLQIVDEVPGGERTYGRDALLAYVQPMRDAMVGNSRIGLWMLMAAIVGLVLIACVNLANAQLGRMVFREREAAVRSAMGASPWQLAWSSLSESLILSVIGGGGGILLAFLAIALFKQYAPVDLPRMAEIQLNPVVLLFSATAVIGSALLFGIMPAIHFVRADPQKALQQSSTRTQGSRQARQLRLILIGLQVFGCTALLLVTGLFAKSLLTLLQTDRGFETGHVMTAQVNLRSHSYEDDAQRATFDKEVLARLRTLPGVTGAALVSAMPLEGETWIDSIERADKHDDHPPLCNLRWVGGEYFEVLTEKLAAGRFLEDRDADLNNVVISESSAKAAWPNEDPVGRQLKWRDKAFTIVGVVKDARTTSLKAAPPNMVYLPYKTLAPYASIFLVRSANNPETLIDAVRRAIWAQDPDVTIARVKSLDSQLNDSLSAERFQTFVLVAFGCAALLLAMLGVYGVLSYVMAARTREIGLRMALGATAASIYSLTLLEAAVPVLVGLGAGWAADILAGRLIQNLLYGVVPNDGWVVLITASLLLICATGGAFLPAHRAAHVDPVQALRAE